MILDKFHTTTEATLRRRRNEKRRTRPRCDSCGCCVRSHNTGAPQSAALVLCRKCQREDAQREARRRALEDMTPDEREALKP